MGVTRATDSLPENGSSRLKNAFQNKFVVIFLEEMYLNISVANIYV